MREEPVDLKFAEQFLCYVRRKLRSAMKPGGEYDVEHIVNAETIIRNLLCLHKLFWDEFEKGVVSPGPLQYSTVFACVHILYELIGVCGGSEVIAERRLEQEMCSRYGGEGEER